MAALDGIRGSGVPVVIDGADLSERRMSIRVYSPAVHAMAPQLLAGYRSPFDGRPGAERAATLGRAPSRFAGNDDNVSALITELLAAEPDATPERRDELIMQAMKEHRAAVYFFDATFLVPKSVSLLHASLQVRAEQAGQAGRAAEAEQWTARAQTVWDAIMAGNQAMLDYLARLPGPHWTLPIF